MYIISHNSSIAYTTVSSFETFLQEEKRTNELGLFDIMPYFWQRRKKPRLFAELDNFNLLEDKDYFLADSKNEDSSILMVLVVYGTYMTITMRVKKLNVALLKKHVQFQLKFYTTLANDPRFKFHFNTFFSIHDFDFPIIRPPRRVAYTNNSILDLFHLDAALEPVDEKFLSTLPSVPFPEQVKVERSDKFLILDWLHQVSDLDGLRHALSVRHQWYHNNFKFNLEYDFNLEGDKSVALWFRAPLEPFTFYDTSDRTGYKATVFDEKGYDEELLAELSEIRKNGKTADGTEVQRIFLILPIRESALMAHETVLSLGLDGVLYLDDKGTFWNPFPEGNWLN